MSVVVGVLTIDLKANTASFSQSMDKMSSLSAKTANDIKRSLERIAVAGVAMAGAIATGTIAMIKGALDSADALGKMAQSAGTTTETLSVLKYAADLSNVATEDLVKGLEKLSASAFKAQNGNVQLERIFGKLGISVTDSNGKLADSGILMEQVAVKFSKMGDSAGKTALAMQLFGKAGAGMIPLLNQYGSEQEKVNEEAHRFGLVLGTSTAEVAMKAHDNLDRMHAVLKGIGFSVLSATLPALDALLQKLIDLTKNADLQSLANAFGQKVTGAVNLLGDALDLATKHAHALKIVLEALVALQLSRIAIPIIADLASGGITKAGEGIAKLGASFLGLTRVLPALAQFGSWLKYTVSFVGLLASEEGVAAAASYALGAGFAAIGGPITVAIAAIAGIGIALYKFRDATFSLGGTTYKLRDTWNAAWIIMGKAVHWIGDEFIKLVHTLGSLWDSLMNKFAQSSIVKYLSAWFTDAFAWIGKMLGKLTPQFVTDALNQAKAEREARERRDKEASQQKALPTGAKPGPPPPDTSGLGKDTESPVNKVLANLKEKLEESKQVLAAAGLEEEAQRKVTAANKANNEILKLGEEIAKQTGAKTKDYASLVDAATKATIRNTYAQISDNEAKTALGNLIGNSSRATALSISQSNLMTAAMDKGYDAVMRQTAVTQAWNELRAKGASLNQILTRSQEIYAESVAKERQTIQGNIISANQELAARRIVTDATLGSIDAQDEAALSAKLYAIDVQIAGTAAGELKNKLIELRATMIALNDEELRKRAFDDARALRDPSAQYDDERIRIERAEAALRSMQRGTITYGQSLQIAMKQQESFNHLIDETVRQLLFEGSAASGMKAFFLDMQKNAITAAQVIYEALHTAFERLSDNLTELVTGGKTSFGKMFEDIGKQMVKLSFQSAMQKGLGALGKALPASIGGPLTDALKGKPDGSRNNPLWVQMAGVGALGGILGGGKEEKTSIPDIGTEGGGEESSSSGISGVLDKLKGSLSNIWSKISSSLGSLLGGIGGIFGKIMGGISGGFGGIFGSLLGGLIPHAEGGSVSPGNAYLIGERGPEILAGASGNITSNVAARRAFGGSAGSIAYYTIDARGTDPAQTEQRTRTALLAVHNSAVSNSVQVQAERMKRIPQR
jgi:hypothetical protein